jgi:ribonuclease P protein component
VAWRRNERGHPRFGVIVPRYQRSAVARNRLRRRLRELLRRGILQQLPPVDVVVRARRGAYDAAFTQLRDELTQLVARVS